MFRFTIRDLLMVVGLGVGWWVDQAMLRTIVRFQNRRWSDHVRREHSATEEEFHRVTAEGMELPTSPPAPK